MVLQAFFPIYPDGLSLPFFPVPILDSPSLSLCLQSTSTSPLHPAETLPSTSQTEEETTEGKPPFQYHPSYIICGVRRGVFSPGSGKALQPIL